METCAVPTYDGSQACFFVVRCSAWEMPNVDTHSSTTQKPLRYPLTSVQIEFVGISRSFTMQTRREARPTKRWRQRHGCKRIGHLCTSCSFTRCSKGKQDQESAGCHGMDARGGACPTFVRHLYFCSAEHNRCSEELTARQRKSPYGCLRKKKKPIVLCAL